MQKNDKTLQSINSHLGKGGIPYEWNDPVEESSDYRFVSEHDESEIIYSNAFKRLAGKSQMIVKPIRDHFRSRLSHTLEVREIALMMGRALGLNTALISAIALGHDLGHAPFGHAGEEALQRIIRREIKTFIGVQIREDEQVKAFHHASNSSRILALWLDQSNNESTVSSRTIRGALQHSWSPWKGNAVVAKKALVYGVPDSYEAQVVAIADQIAAINHDTEDLLEAYEFTGYTVERFDREMRAKLSRYKTKKGYDHAKAEQLTKFFSPTLNVDREHGYGRKERIEHAIRFVVENGSKVISSTSAEKAAAKHIPGEGLFGEFLDLYEDFVRDVLNRHTWFIGRNSMADAIVATVFNHLWPTAQVCAGIERHDRVELAEARRKKRAEQSVEVYRDHYRQFYKDSYEEPARDYNLKLEYDCIVDTLGFDAEEIWSSFLIEKCTERLTRGDSIDERYKKLLAIIPLIHFVSGLTDRYCLEIFNATHRDFLSS